MNRLLFAEQFYFPDGWGGVELPKAVTSMFAEAGYDVRVVCGSDQYVPTDGNTVTHLDPRESGVRISRVPKFFGGRIHSSKLLRQLWFCLAFLPLSLFRRRPDALIVQTNPPPIVVVARVVSLLIRRPLIVIAQDVYPEILVSHGSMSSGSFFYRALDRAFSWAYRGASAVVSLGPSMTSRIVGKGVMAERVFQIQNWATGDLELDRKGARRLRDELEIGDQPVLMYSGNIGIGHEFETLIGGFEKALVELPELILLIAGRGSRYTELRELVDRNGLQKNVRFSDFVPLDVLPASLGIADVAVVTLRPGFEGLIAPSKAIGYIGRGLPTLYVGPPSDISQLIDDANCGVVSKNGDVAHVAKSIRSFFSSTQHRDQLSRNAKSYYSKHLDRQVAMNSYRKLVDHVLQE